MRLIQLSKNFVLKYKYLLALLLIVAIHSYEVISNAVNLPYWDEWESLNSGAIPAGFTVKWIFAPHSEHMIAISKMLFVLFYKLNGLNFTYLISFSWFTFLLLAFTLYRIALKTIPDEIKRFLPLVFIFLFSPILHENHEMGFQICFHFSLLFQIFGIYWAVTYGTNKIGDLMITGLFFLLSCYSLSIGLPMTMASLGGLLICKFFNRSPDTIEKSGPSVLAGVYREILSIIPLVVVVCIGLIYWVIRYQDVSHKIHMTKILSDMEYWKFILSQVGLGYGFNEHPQFWWLGLVPFLIYFFCGLYLLLKRNFKLQPEPRNKTMFVWFIFGLCIFAAQATIALGRYSMGPKQALSSRYSEIALMWIPITACLLFDFLKDYLPTSQTALGNYVRLPKSISAYFSFFVVLLFLGFSDDWDFRHYRNMAAHKLEGIECLKKAAISSFENALCPSIYPENLGAERLLNAKKFNFSFSQSY